MRAPNTDLCANDDQLILNHSLMSLFIGLELGGEALLTRYHAVAIALFFITSERP